MAAKNALKISKLQPVDAMPAEQTGLTEMPSQQMQERWHVGEARRRHLLDHTDRPSKKIPNGKRQHHGREDPQHQEFIFPRHGRPPTAIKRPGKPDGLQGRKRTLRLGRGRCWFLWLWRFIADHPYLAEQFRHLHARESFEERRHLRGHLGDVAGQLVSAGGVAVSG